MTNQSKFQPTSAVLAAFGTSKEITERLDAAASDLSRQVSLKFDQEIRRILSQAFPWHHKLIMEATEATPELRDLVSKQKIQIVQFEDYNLLATCYEVWSGKTCLGSFKFDNRYLP